MAAVFELRSTKGLGTLKINQAWLRVGRAPDNNLVVSDPTVSRYHLNFYIKDDSLICEDAGSQNGFLVNGTPTKAATVLNPGDRLYFGSLEYVVVRTDRGYVNTQAAAASSAAQFSAANAQPIYASASTASAPGNSGRMRLYIGLVVGLALMFVFLSDDDNKKPKSKNELLLEIAEEDIKTMSPDGFKSAPRPPKSLTEITAEGKLREGLRELDNTNYVRALLAFEEARTNNPSMDMIETYIQEAQGSLNSQLKKLKESSDISFSRMQFQRSKAEALQILTILAEQIPGYARKLATESFTQPGDSTRAPTQEEILLKIPCDRLPKGNVSEVPAPATSGAAPAQVNYVDICNATLKRIKEARIRLGEEDSLR